jgi:hypothetical protein
MSSAIDPAWLAKIKAPAGYHVVMSADGGISIVADTPAPSISDTVKAWMTARAGETSTKIGAIGGAVAAPTIAENAGKAVMAGLAGDYVDCALYGVPALIGIAGAIAAIIIPEKQKGPTGEEIHASVARMSRDQLISLLGQPAETSVLQPAQSSI